MAAIGILADDAKTRGELKLVIEELGYRAMPAKDIQGALELLGGEHPKLFVVAQSEEDKTSEALLAELERQAPLLPVVTAMRERRAARAIELMKAGVFEAVAPPWTAENFSACLSKAIRCKGTELEVVHPREETKGVLQYFLLALVVLALAVGYSALGKRKKLAEVAARDIPRTEWALPYNHPSGLAYDGKQIWVADWFSKSIYLHDPRDMTVVRAVHFPREVPGAITFAGDALWIAASPRSIVKHMLDKRLEVVGRYRDRLPQTIAMAYDGLYLWTCDSKKGRLHKRILDEDLSVVESFDYPGARAAALAFDGTTLWSLDAGNREILRHDLAKPYRITMRLPAPQYRSGEWKPTGLVWRGDGFWSVAERMPKGQGPGRLFSHALPQTEPERP